MIDNSGAIGVPRIIEPKHILTCNVKVNTIFLSYIFNTRHGLAPLGPEFNPVEELPEDPEGTREERQFKIWINSLGIEGCEVTDLYDDVRSGILLCKVLDKIQPGSINWKLVK